MKHSTYGYWRCPPPPHAGRVWLPVGLGGGPGGSGSRGRSGTTGTAAARSIGSQLWALGPGLCYPQGNGLHYLCRSEREEPQTDLVDCYWLSFQHYHRFIKTMVIKNTELFCCYNETWMNVSLSELKSNLLSQDSRTVVWVPSLTTCELLPSGGGGQSDALYIVAPTQHGTAATSPWL